jgi:subtilisin family serine protease
MMSLLIGLLFGKFAVAQQAGDIVPGRLYLKIQNDANLILPEIRDTEDLSELEDMGLQPLADLFSQYGVNYMRRGFPGISTPELDNTYTLKFEQRQGQELELIETLEGQFSYIEYAEGEPICDIDLLPNDPRYSQQWYLPVINAASAWDLSTGSDKVVIAVVDASTLTTHPDLADNIWVNPGEIPNNGVDDDGNGYVDDVNGWDSGNNDNDPNPPSAGINHTHGTMVGGSVSAVTNNNVGISGIGFSCKIMAVKAKSDVVNPQSPTSLNNTVGGVAYAVAAGADIINMSYGGPGSSNTVQNLINAGHDQGIIFISSSGNDGTNGLRYPSSYNHVISVGATNSNDQKANFSNYANTVDLMAPGVDILTTSHTGGGAPIYESVMGTSFSTPIVAGVAGLMLAINPCLTPDEVETILKNTCDNIDAANPNWVGRLGAGRVNAQAAVAAVVPTSAPLATFTYDTLNTCDGNIQFFYQGIAGACPLNIFWAFNGQNSDELNPVFTVPGSGTYNLTLVVNNSLGSNQTTVPITINDVITADAGGDENGLLTACFGNLVQMDAQTSAIGATVRWQPTIGITNPNVLDPIITVTTNRTYTMTITDISGCQVTDEVDIMVVNSVDAGPNQTINLGDSAQLDVQVTGSGYTYSWSPAQWLDDPTAKNPKASPPGLVVYTVTATTFSGCELTDDMTLTVDGGTGINEDFLRVAEVQAAFPNPARTRMNFAADLKETTDLKVTAYDLNGRVVKTLFQQKQPQGSLQFSWQRNEATAAGLYLVVWEANGQRYVQKVNWQ